nr:hypothetical protein BaRGS_032715 [Batillaria attramentaria]
MSTFKARHADLYCNLLRNTLMTTTSLSTHKQTTVKPVDFRNCTVDADNVHEQAKQIALIPLTPLIMLSNILVLCLVVYLKHYRRPSFLLLVSLCCADMLVGFTCIGTLVTVSREDTLSPCLVRVGLSVTAVQASIFSLLAVACDRLLAIVRALTYLQVVTTRRTLVVILLLWVFSLLLGLLPLLGWNEGEDSYKGYCSFLHVFPPSYVAAIFVCGLLPVGAILLIHVYLYAHARVHIRKIDAMEQVLGRKEVRALGMTGRSWRCFRTVTMVTGCVFACWFPFLLTTLYVLLAPSPHCVLSDIVGTHLLMLGYCNSALNPVVYASRNKELRSGCVTAFRRRCSQGKDGTG